MSTGYNRNIHQPGASAYPRFAISKKSLYKSAVVEDIIVNETHPDYNLEKGINVGMALVRVIPDGRGLDRKKLKWIFPMESSISDYPLKNEVVLIFSTIGGAFYTRRLNLTNKVTDSRWIGLTQQYAPANPSDKKSQFTELAFKGGPVTNPIENDDINTTPDEYFENQTVRRVRPNEGDIIIQGRFGNSVRFGSNLFSNPTARTLQPNLLLTVGQALDKKTSTRDNQIHSLVVEDINNDKSCIWMVSDEKVVLKPATMDSNAHLRGSDTSDSTQYTGAQIFINSDRLILNSKQNEISLFANKEINLSAIKSITISSANQVEISADKDIILDTPLDIVLTGRTISLNSKNDISQGTTKNYTISGKKIFIGSGGDESQPMVLGGELADWLQRLMAVFIADLPRALATLNPGPVINKLVDLRRDLGITPQSATFNSTSNFTAKVN
jgi:hypothetical protein